MSTQSRTANRINREISYASHNGKNLYADHLTHDSIRVVRAKTERGVVKVRNTSGAWFAVTTTTTFDAR